MTDNFLHTTLGRTGLKVHRLGLSASYRPGRQAIHRAVELGLNYFFCYGFDNHMTGALREILPRDRQKFVVATGPYNLIWGHTNFRKTLEKRLRQLQTDYIDIFLFLGVMKGKQFPPHLRDELRSLRDEGKIKAIGCSSHDRKFAGQLLADNEIDVIMMRYNAAHRGAEDDIFPRLGHNPGVVSYTATRWSYLLRRPKGWPKEGRIPTAGECYRFVLSNPHVHVCMTAPKSMKEIEENIAAVQRGPLGAEDLAFMRQFGDIVHAQKKWFM